MSTVPPTPQTPGAVQPLAPAPQKSSGNKVLFWVLGIVLGLVVLSFATCAVVGFYAMHKARQAGFSSDLMKKNPGYAGAKIAMSMNRDVEVLSSDDDAGSMVVKDKKTGKVVTMKFDPEKKSMVIVDENGKTTSMAATGEGANAGFEMKTSEGTMKMGAGSDKAPDWVPVYPGSSPQNAFSASTGGEQSGSYTFVTADATGKVIAFYEDALQSGGFAVSNMTSNSEGQTGGMLSGENKSNKRTVAVTLGTESDGTHVNVTYSVKQ